MCDSLPRPSKKPCAQADSRGRSPPDGPDIPRSFIRDRARFSGLFVQKLAAGEGRYASVDESSVAQFDGAPLGGNGRHRRSRLQPPSFPPLPHPAVLGAADPLLPCQDATFEVSYSVVADKHAGVPLVRRVAAIGDLRCPSRTTYLPIKCGQCGLALVRIPQPEAHDLVICTGCRSAGSYEEVISQGHGMVTSVLTEKQVKDFFRQIGVGEK
jgi:hypothetical protein